MKRLINVFAVLALLTAGSYSCTQDEVTTNDAKVISQDVLQKIAQLGFSTSKVIKEEDGYIVEGDIFLHEYDLNGVPNAFRVPGIEQYHTFNLVAGLPRLIKISISSQLPSSYVAALDEAIARYNAENLQITMQRVSSGANISIVKGNGSYLASAGFPTSGGDPYNQIKVNSRAIGNQPQSTVASILAHEIGHCIGFRHTDWFDRSISCGGSPTNEGQSTTGVGAVHIPGTPTGATNSAQSFMLSCIGSGQNRPFNNDDITALNYLY